MDASPPAASRQPAPGPEFKVPGLQSYTITNIIYTVPENSYGCVRSKPTAVPVFNKDMKQLGKKLTQKDGAIYAFTGIWTPSPSGSTFIWTKSEETKTKGTQYIRIDPGHQDNLDLLDKFGGEENLYVEKGKLTKVSQVARAGRTPSKNQLLVVAGKNLKEINLKERNPKERYLKERNLKERNLKERNLSADKFTN